MTLRVEYIKKEELKPYANNAKIHTAEQVEHIKKSISEFGFNDPIAIWGENEVVEGHGRLIAAMEMDEIDEVPVIRLDHLTDEQRRAYALVHNKLTLDSGFELDILEEELDALWSIDMSAYGFEEMKVQIDALDLDTDTKNDAEENMESYKCPKCGFVFEVSNYKQSSTN